MRTTVYCATSLDGFIAREDGSIDWLGSGPVDGGKDNGYAAFMDSVDVLVMGRHTYEVVKDFEPWPYGSKPVVVLTTRAFEIPSTLSETVSTLNATPEGVIKALQNRGAKHLYIDGGRTIQRFLNAGLIDRFIVTRIPILIGKGIPLFGPIPNDIKLHHVATESFSDGLTQSEYVVEHLQSG